MSGNQAGVFLSSSKQQFLEFYRDRGLPEELCQSYAIYASRLRNRGLPVLFEVEHLSERLGLQREFVAKAINAPESFYRQFEIKKKLGGVRRILTPYPSLLQAQTWIKRNILDHFHISDSAYAFKRNTSIIKNAQNHTNKPTVLTLDLCDFFGSIKKEWVIKTFRELGYSPQISFYLASMCCHSGALPQGAPTSPVLSNIVCRTLDARISGLAKSADLTYTRYADDLAFSGNRIPKRFIRKVAEIVESSGFKVNDKKTQLMTSSKRKVITGINVTSENLSLTRNFKRELKKEAFFITKFGLRGHLEKRKIKDPLYIDRLIGKANYWYSVESWNPEAYRVLKLFQEKKRMI